MTYLSTTFKQKKKEVLSMGIPASSFIDKSLENLSDKDFMKAIQQIDESSFSQPLSSLRSPSYTKMKKCIKFMPYGQL